MERTARDLGKKAAESGRYVYVAGALALTEPGPAAIGIVVADERGRIVSQRSRYLGQMTRREASALALLEAAQLARQSGLERPVFRIDDVAIADAVASGRALPGEAGEHMVAVRQALTPLVEATVEAVSPAANPARAAALTPLVEWLPERTRRSEGLNVRQVGEHAYQVESERTPGDFYTVVLRPVGAAGDGDPIACECGDFVHRGIPCKHLLAVARETGALDRVFHRTTPH